MIIIPNGVNGSPMGDPRETEVNRGNSLIISKISLHNTHYATPLTPVGCVAVWLSGDFKAVGDSCKCEGKETRKAGDNTREREYNRKDTLHL